MNFFHQHDMTNQFPEGMTFFMNHPVYIGAKGDWDFRISDLVKSTYGTDIYRSGEVRRAQLAKSTLLTSTLVPLGSFKVCSDAKKKVGCGKQPHLFSPW